MSKRNSSESGGYTQAGPRKSPKTNDRNARPGKSASPRSRGRGLLANTSIADELPPPRVFPRHYGSVEPPYNRADWGFTTGPNDCYRASVFQVYMALYPVKCFLRQAHAEYHHTESATDTQCLACALNRLYNTYWHFQSEDEEQIRRRVNEAATSFFNVCISRGWMSSEDINAQQDAPTFFTWIVETIAKDFRPMR